MENDFFFHPVKCVFRVICVNRRCKSSFKPWWYCTWLLSSQGSSFKDCYPSCESHIPTQGKNKFLVLSTIAVIGWLNEHNFQFHDFAAPVLYNNPAHLVSYLWCSFEEIFLWVALSSMSCFHWGHCQPDLWPKISSVHSCSLFFCDVQSDDEREMCSRTVYCTNIDKKVFLLLLCSDSDCLQFCAIEFTLYISLQISQAEVKNFFETACGEVRLELYFMLLAGNWLFV